MSNQNDTDPDPPELTPGLLPALSAPSTQGAEQEVETGGEGWAVVLFDGAQHTHDEVTLQIVLATGCPWEIAAEAVRRVSLDGQAIVALASRAEAERIAVVLRRIALLVAVERI